MYTAGNNILTYNGQFINPPTPFVSGITTYTGGSNTFTLPAGCTTLEYLCVAGGGAGGRIIGSKSSAGGGGAGGYLAGTINSPTAGNYTCIVGVGGYKGQPDPELNTPGDNSSIAGTSLNVVSIGGGAGFSSIINPSVIITGGSGGGGLSYYPYANGGTGIVGQGHNGGDGGSNHGGGGGGAGGAGGNKTAGIGTSNSITGGAVTYATGGTGGDDGDGIGGNGSDATANTGNGGQGAACIISVCDKRGGNGGSGIIILKYK